MTKSSHHSNSALLAGVALLAVIVSAGCPPGGGGSPAPSAGPAPNPGANPLPPVTQINFDRSGPSMTLTAGAQGPTTFSYADVDTARTAFTIAATPGNSWVDPADASPDFIEFKLKTKAAIMTAFNVSDLQLDAFQKVGTGMAAYFQVDFTAEQPVANTAAMAQFSLANYADAQKLADLLASSEAARSRLSLSQASGTDQLVVHFTLE
jgi:hypothetical protein